MTIRTPHLILPAVLILLIGACGADPSANSEDVSATLTSKLTTSDDSQQLNPVDSPIGKCHGKCCNFVCGTGGLNSVPRECETCNPYATGFCATRGGLEEAWWGHCR